LLSLRAQDPVLDVVLTASVFECLGAELLHAGNVVRMHPGLPRAARGLDRSFGQAVDDGIPFRYLHPFHVGLVGVGADQAGLPRQRQLGIALDQGLLRLLAIADVDGHADDADHRARGIAQRRRIGHDRDAPAVHTLEDELAAVHAHTPPQRNLCWTIAQVRRRSVGLIEAAEVGPLVRAEFGAFPPQIDGALVAVGDAAVRVRDIDRGGERPQQFAERALAVLQPRLRPLDGGDVARDALQGQGVAVVGAHNDALDRDPALLFPVGAVGGR
jgi:hypothetical protein